jgi:hypothetical protein
MSAWGVIDTLPARGFEVRKVRSARSRCSAVCARIAKAVAAKRPTARAWRIGSHLTERGVLEACSDACREGIADY